jgi:5-(carboxyamino)imidazole ribonucleotide synthase
LEIDGAHIHLYGKGPRPGRKLGHVTVCADDLATARQRARTAAEALTGEPIPGEA